jgi:dihydrofolate reductase
VPLTQYLVASSLDGFIADEADNLDWLMTMPGGDEDTNPYPAYLASVGALAMGATTYQWLLDHDDGPWPYSQPCWVFTHRSFAPRTDGDVRFTSAAAPEIHAEMTDACGDRNLWLVGGGDLVGQFLDHDLVDELIVSITPVLLGAGRPLLPRRRTEPMRLLSCTPARAGTFVHLHYSLR